MKRDNIGRHILIVFVIAITAYFGLFHLNEWLRTRRGAWELIFAVEGGTPSLTVSEPKLNIRDVKLLFAGETVTNLTKGVPWVFDDVMKTNLPFGAVIFHDLTYQPGTMTMNLFGHEVELLPRTLAINRKSVPWESGKKIVLQPAEKIPPDASKEKARY